MPAAQRERLMFKRPVGWHRALAARIQDLRQPSKGMFWERAPLGRMLGTGKARRENHCEHAARQLCHEPDGVEGVGKNGLELRGCSSFHHRPRRWLKSSCGVADSPASRSSAMKPETEAHSPAGEETKSLQTPTTVHVCDLTTATFPRDGLVAIGNVVYFRCRDGSSTILPSMLHMFTLANVLPAEAEDEFRWSQHCWQVECF